MAGERKIKGGKMEWGPKGRKEASDTLPSVKRGKKGKEGDEMMIFCPFCHRHTYHILKVISNPHPRPMWVCPCGKHKVPGRLF